MRLTKIVRKQIINNSLIQSGIIKEEKKLSETIAKLAEDCRMFSFGGETEYAKMIVNSKEIKRLTKLLQKEADFSEFYLSKSQYIYVSFGGKSVYLQYMGSFRNNHYHIINNGSEPSYKSGFNAKYISKINPRNILMLPANNNLSKRFERIHNNMEILKSKRSALITKLYGALSTYTTTNNLLKDWPDMKPLIPLPVEKSAKHLPAIRVKELNKLIGLPVK